jgi:hypothetical protein
MHGVVLNGGAHGQEFAGKLVAQFTGNIASRLNKASALTTAAERRSSQGLTQDAFTTLLDIEPLIFEAIVPAGATSRRVRPLGTVRPLRHS